MVRPRKSVTTSARRWSARSSAFCCPTASCQPLASNLEARVDAKRSTAICIKAGLLALYKGNPPAIAIEFARRVLPHDVRPSFNETEQFCARAGKAGSDAQASRAHEPEAGAAGHRHQEDLATAKHGHHGGAWKVAYADFVTAMMAFFLVMWIVNTSPQVKTGVASYFRDPGVFQSTSGGGRCRVHRRAPPRTCRPWTFRRRARRWRTPPRESARSSRPCRPSRKSRIGCSSR